MIRHCYYANVRDPMVHVLIHEGTVLDPIVFSFEDEPDVFYRSVEVELSVSQCDRCDAGKRHCNAAPRCGQKAPVSSWTISFYTGKVEAKHIGATSGNYLAFERFDYRPIKYSALAIDSITL